MREEKKEKQRINILESGAAVFSEKGYVKTTISDVAARASIGKGTVYGYFESKEDLFFQVFRWYNDQIMGAISPDVFDPAVPADRHLIRLTESVMTSVTKMIDFYSLALEFWAAVATTANSDAFKAEFNQLYNDFIGLIKSILDQGVEAGLFSPEADTENTARGMISILDAYGLQYWLGQNFDPVAKGVAMVETVLNGIRR